MPDQWILVDRSCAKRSSGECTGPFAKRQRRVVDTTTSKPPAGKGTQQLPTPPSTIQSNVKQGGVSTVTTTTTTTAGELQRFPADEEIPHLFDNLQKMVTLWVEECLPDVFPPEFGTSKPERYWELCGWTRPLSPGNTLLQNRSWAKYVYESWVWRLLHQEIFRVDSLAWAGFDVPVTSGGLGGLGRATNKQFDFLKEGQQKISHNEYRDRIVIRAATMKRVREQGAVTENRKIKTTGWLVEEMLVAFHPYFTDEYQHTDHPENIEVLIRDTRFLIVKAQELDEKLRSAKYVYEMILDKDGDVARSSSSPSKEMKRYSVHPDGGDGRLRDDDQIALIVVPGLVKNVIKEHSAGVSPQLTQFVRRRARAFTQIDLTDAINASSS
ncbi:hypothetical protein DHEL01_v210593 [Diaporthe helianthi]|uniref:Uncharacterized protein n=1 Tax=Diaporthe helianthi TaxID=158607 RepID=A0A2P5HL78_DIAHE|nr:hypothetical protein DHEL01_v210593 [Diaporthe helianthi]